MPCLQVMAKARAAYLRRLSRTAVRTVNPYGARAYSRARRAFSRLLAASAKFWTSGIKQLAEELASRSPAPRHAGPLDVE